VQGENGAGNGTTTTTTTSSSSSSGFAPQTQTEALAWLEAQGFAVNPDNQRVQGFAAAVEAAEQWMTQREQLGESWPQGFRVQVCAEAV
jgi:NAD-dependent DNA ligase